MPPLLPTLVTLALAAGASCAPPPALPGPPPCTAALALRAHVPPGCTCSVRLLPPSDDATQAPSTLHPLHAVTGVSVVGWEAGAVRLAIACGAGCAATPHELMLENLTPCRDVNNSGSLLEVAEAVRVSAEGVGSGANARAAAAGSPSPRRRRRRRCHWREEEYQCVCVSTRKQSVCFVRCRKAFVTRPTAAQPSVSTR